MGAARTARIFLVKVESDRATRQFRHIGGAARHAGQLNAEKRRFTTLEVRGGWRRIGWRVPASNRQQISGSGVFATRHDERARRSSLTVKRPGLSRS